MSHANMRDRLIALAGNTAGDSSDFLDGLSPIHVDWHDEFQHTYGFLLFHHRVVRYFNNIVNAGLQPPITAFAANDFQGMNAQPFQGNLANIDTLGELASFSNSIESWHGGAHMQIGTATGTPMMDPAQNIYFRPFWRLHLYIDGLFRTVLQQYGNRAHPNQFVNPTAVAGHIESSHHSWVPRI